MVSVQPKPNDNSGNNYSFYHFFLSLNCHKLHYSWSIIALLFRIVCYVSHAKLECKLQAISQI